MSYAQTWALSRNPLFVNFSGRGGDCTAFASQSLLAGSCTMNYTKDLGWYYISTEDRAPAWSGVEFFYDFITQQPAFRSENGGVGPYGREVEAYEVVEGDFIQLADRTGDFYHTLVITGFEPGDILVCAHSDDSLNRRLSTYNYASLRYIHIDGVAIEVADDSCYEALIEGEAILVNQPPANDQTGEETPAVPEQEDAQPQPQREESGINNPQIQM